MADIKADSNLPINSDSYDFILCNHVLEHIIDDEKAMKELYRVLKRWDRYLQYLNMSNKQTFEDFTITDPKERNKAFGQYDHVRVYGMDFLKGLEK